MGSGTFVIRSTGNTGTASGTSVASPLLASLLTGLVQRYDTLTRAELIQLVKSTASLSASPNSQLGYGIPNFAKARAKMELITDLENPLGKVRFDVFPNPADSGFVYVQAREWQPGRQVLIELVDMRGTSLQQSNFSPLQASDKAIIDLSNTPAGVFMIRITSANHSDIFKIVNVR